MSLAASPAPSSAFPAETNAAESGGHRARSESSTPDNPRWLFLFLNAVAVGIAYGPLLGQFFVRQWSLPQYQYFPFVMGAFVWLLIRNTRDASPPPQRHPRIRAALNVACLIIAWGLLGVAYLIPSPWLAMVSAILAVGVGLLKLSQQRQIRYVLGLWLMLWLMVPLPLNRDQDLITGLQRLSSQLSSAFLDALGVEHLMEGNTLTLPGKQFFVDEACSGIVSLLSVTACAVIYGIWRDRRGAHVIVLALCGIGWATLMNVGRITTIAIVYDWFDADWSTGANHQILGLVFFLLVFLTLVCTDLFLVGFLAPIEPSLREVVGTPQPLGRNWMRLWDWMFTPRAGDTELEEAPAGGISRRFQPMCWGWGTLATFVALPALSLVAGNLWRTENPGIAIIPRQRVDRALTCQQSTLPAQIQKLSVVKFSPIERERNDILGNFSRTYEYRDGDGMPYVVSCDFPYQGGWHELTICYRGIGWDLEQRRIVREEADAKGRQWMDMEAAFTKPDGNQGFLIACAFDENGTPLEIPTSLFWADLWNRFIVGISGPPSQVAFQVQVWVVAAQPISDEQRATARELLRQARERFHFAIINPTPKNL